MARCPCFHKYRASTPSRQMRCCIGWMVACFCVLIWGSPVQAAERVKQAMKIGYFSDFWVQDAREGEVRTQFEQWVREVRSSPSVRAEADPPLSYKEFSAKWDGSNDLPWDVFPMYGYDFVDIRQRCNLDVLLVPSWSDGPLVEYSIYVPQASRINKISELHKKTILCEIDGRGSLPLYWFDNQIRKHCQNQQTDDVCKLLSVSTPMLAALPMFFGEDNVEACLLSSSGYSQVVSGNPALRQFLRPLAPAPQMLTHVIACRKDLSNERRQEVIRISMQLSERNNKLVNGLHFNAFKPEYLTNVEHEWNQWLANIANDPPEPQPSNSPAGVKPKDFMEAKAAAAGTSSNARRGNAARTDKIYPYPTPPP